MAGSNYVAYNLAQTRTDAEKLQARNNIGAAGLSSLAESFESRAPSYNWSANEVCTYGGKLWMFDSNHSGAWTGADAYEINIFELINNTILYKQPKEYFNDWIDISDEFTYKNNFRGWRGGSAETLKVEYSKEGRLIQFGAIHFIKTTATSQNDWNIFLKYDGDRFYTMDSPSTPGVSRAITVFFGYPIGIRSCVASLFNGLDSNGSTMGGFALVQYIQGGFAMKPSINYSSSTFRGVELSETYWNVTPKP